MQFTEQVMEEIKNQCMAMPGAYEARPFGEYPICYKVMGKIFAQLNPQEDFFRMTLKCEPEKGIWYRELYPGIVVRGYHCPPVQQPYWNTIDLRKFEDEQILFDMIKEAYQALIKKFTKKQRTQLLELSELEYCTVDGEDSDFAYLCEKLDANLDELVGAKFQRSQYVQYNKRDSIHDVIVIYRDGNPVACGGFKHYDEEHAELKRIYVDPSCRGIGLGAEIVRRLEAKAKIKGYRYGILETGEPLEAACHLYKRLGYKVIENYGQYADMPNSICMQKRL